MTRKLQKAVLFVCPSGAVAEHFVRKDPGENKAQGKSNDDQDRSCKPGGGNIQGHDPQIVDCPVEIKSGNHDHNGWYGNGNPGYPTWFDEGGQKSGCQCSEKAAAAGGKPARSTSSRRKVLDSAPMKAAAAASRTGLLNMTEKPNTPQKLARSRNRIL